MTKTVTFIAGAGAGLLAGLFFGPGSKEFRHNLSDKLHEGVDTVKGKIDEGRRAIQDQGGIRGVVEKGIERGRNVANMGRQRVNESMESAKNRFNESIEAGKTEYHNTLDRGISGI